MTKRKDGEKNPSRSPAGLTNARGIGIPVEQGIGIPAYDYGKELRSVLADCSEFLASEGASTEAKESNALAHRCEAMLSQVANDDASPPTPDLVNDVTRFLLQPGLTVGHPSLEFDLKVTVAAPMEDGFQVGVQRDDGQTGMWVFPLSELFPVGILHAATRVVIDKLLGARFDDMIGELQKSGRLLTPDMTDSGRVARSRRPEGTSADCPACEASGICGTCAGLGWVEVAAAPGTVHALQVHPEYLIEPGGVSAKPVDE